MNSKVITDILESKFPKGETEGFVPFDFIHKYGTPLFALLYSHLFWPNFVEIDGMIFLEDEFEDEDDYRRLEEAIARYRNKRSIE